MARPKRVPYKPDRFQEKGRKVVSWLREREAATLVAVAVVVLGFILTVVLVGRYGANEEDALNALYNHRGNVDRLEEALTAYGSTSARPFTLLQVAVIDIEEPLDDDGKPKKETDAEREKRLARAEKVLRTLVDGYPTHELYPYGLTLLGAVLEEQGEYQDGVDVLRKALEVAPATLEAKIRYDVGRLYVLMEDNDSARPYLLEARAKSSRQIQAPSPDGRGWSMQAPAWFQNAEHLLARIGTGEKQVEFPKPEPPPEPKPKPEARAPVGRMPPPEGAAAAAPAPRPAEGPKPAEGATPAEGMRAVEEAAPAGETKPTEDAEPAEDTEADAGAGEAETAPAPAETGTDAPTEETGP
jgi:tetratricopeptide (TPR) repeat protein